MYKVKVFDFSNSADVVEEVVRQRRRKEAEVREVVDVEEWIRKEMLDY